MRAGPLLLFAIVACGDRDARRVIPEPAGLEQLGEDVRAQYAEYRERLDRRLAEPDPSPSDLARAYGQLGMWHDLYEFHDSAEACYLEAGRLDAADPRWPYYMGHVYRSEGRLAEARQAFGRVRKLDPELAPAWVWGGEVELADGRPAVAEGLFDTALELDPDCVRAWLGRGKAALAQQDYEAAIERLERALALQPSGTEIHYTLGLAYRGRGELDKAERYLRAGQVPNRDRIAVAMDDPLLVDLQSLRRDHHAVNRRAKRLLAEGRHEEAIVELTRLVGQDPDTADWRNNLALALQRAGRPDEALTQIDELLRRNPGNAKAHFARAVLRAGRGELGAAEADYREAINADPDYLQARFNLGNLLRLDGRHEQALEHYEAAVRLDPANQLARYWRAHSLIALERWVEARRTLETDLEQVEAGADGLRLLLARVLSAAPFRDGRDGARALELAGEAFRRTASLAHAETVAMALAELGRFEAAVAWQEACLEAASTADDRIRAWVADRLQRYGKGLPARQIWAPGEHPTRIEVVAPDGWF